METFGDAKMLAGQTQNVALGHKKPQNPHQTAPDTMLKRKVEAFSYQSLHSRGRGHGSPKDLSFRMEPCSNIYIYIQTPRTAAGQAMHRHCFLFLCFINQLCSLQRPRQSDIDKNLPSGFNTF